MSITFMAERFKDTMLPAISVKLLNRLHVPVVGTHTGVICILVHGGVSLRMCVGSMNSINTVPVFFSSRFKHVTHRDRQTFCFTETG